MIESLIVAVAALGALAWVTLPVRVGGPRRTEEDSAEVADATARKNTALIALLELEEERDSGKLSENDYEDLRGRYELEAVDALRKADAAAEPAAVADDPTPAPGEDDLEAEIRRIKASLRCESCGRPKAPGEPCTVCGG